MDNKKIGLFIANLRKEIGLTQKELADKLYITDRAVSKWERGLSLPDISLLDNLSSILGVSVVEILKGERIKDISNDEEVIHSLEYAKVSFKEKINNIFNIASITIILVIMSILLFNNMKIYLIQGIKYYPNIQFVDNTYDIFDNLEKSINLIKNDKGKYKDDEYKQIISFIGDITNIESDRNMFNRESYKYNDFKIVSEKHLIIHSRLDIMGIENILEKYGVILNIDSYYDGYYSNLSIIKKFINNSYKYNYVIDYEYNKGNDIKNLIYYEYCLYNIILDKVIEAGEIK